MSLSAAPREFPFTLPHGYTDPAGVTHREGMMRLATKNDELAPLVDPRVRENPSYLGVVLLGLVITRLGTAGQPDPAVIESLFPADLAHLQKLYREINGAELPGGLPDTV
ncbi:hypothetical protein [Streptomyces sp. NBC_00162]|uniref:hypothetical protein n=1 Tax=Streptomyces sp. NBC_00162 TaxID=2903629 RepID=UPI00214B6487|nr:hypothetical protein [Streptomyces sp. NBC_00162]UUU45158.1 hypothetical protein JIW86_41230 [Streptomyces sp. NBC_00162]